MPEYFNPTSHPNMYPGHGMAPPIAMRRKKHWAVNGAHPTQVHDTLAAAREAAHRQAALKPGTAVVIYEAIETYEVLVSSVQKTTL